MSQDIALIEALYRKSAERHAHGRKQQARPLTLTEKVLWAHLHDPNSKPWRRGESFLELHPDRVAMRCV